MISQEQFDKAMKDAIKACNQAKWTHEQRLVFYGRMEAEISKEYEEERIMGRTKDHVFDEKFI